MISVHSTKRKDVKVLSAGLNSDKAFDVINTVLSLLLLVIFIWPLWFVLIASISEPNAVWNGQVYLLPKGINLNGYREIIRYSNLWLGYRNTILYTVLGTAINLALTICAAYPISKKTFMPRNFFTFIFMLTMYIHGGLIPTFMVVNGLGITNTIWAMIIPNAISIYNVIIMRSYFSNSIPDSLEEAADLDGANDLQYLLRVVLPLSKPIIAVIALYYAVGHWNNFYSALIYINDRRLFPLQTFLRDILISGQISLDMMGLDPEDAAIRMQLTQTIKYGVIIVASVPVLCIYPFVQKYFVRGVMIGSIKG